jgi:hypothetical protein
MRWIRIEVAHELAISMWCAGDIDGAVGLLEQVLDRATSSLGSDHPLRVDLLITLAGILVEQRHLEQSSRSAGAPRPPHGRQPSKLTCGEK